jgi:glycosyltransferase involved in cell wall biosynthesis
MAASRVHLVHVGLEWSAQYGVVAARLARRPVVCHVRDLLSYKAFRREFVPLSSRVIANSRAVADVVSSYNFPRERIHTIHNGVDLSWFSPDPVRREAFRRKLGIAEGEWAVGLLAARIDALKGQVEFVRALRLSKDRGTSVRGIVTGRNPPESRMDHLGRLKQLVAKLQLDGNVVFTGFVDDMRGLYDALDLVVVASKAEPFGRTIIEAMAMGKPVVSTAAGGPLEILQDGATGLLVPPDDPSAVADAMVRLACDRRLAAQLGMAGRTRAEDSFCIERSVQATEGVYRSLLEIG